MKAKLLTFLFLGILAALSYRLLIDVVYERFFAASSFFELYWYLPWVVAPAMLLGLLAWSLGFYRRGGKRGPDAAVTLVLAGLVILAIPASYSCTLGCF
jgi:hypothetical protein